MVFLKDLTIRIRNENCASANVAIHTYKDAKAMKALTTTATAFLPASLIAVCPICPNRLGSAKWRTDNIQLEFSPGKAGWQF